MLAGLERSLEISRGARTTVIPVCDNTSRLACIVHSGVEVSANSGDGLKGRLQIWEGQLSERVDGLRSKQQEEGLLVLIEGLASHAAVQLGCEYSHDLLRPMYLVCI